MLIAIYDYLGYYNICHLGDEVIEPKQTIPRAVLLSVGIVAAIYLTMNVAIIGVIPWQEAMRSQNIAALVFNGVALWAKRGTGLHSADSVDFGRLLVCAADVGDSRIPDAAAKQGDFFAVFGRTRAGNFRSCRWRCWAG